MGITACLDRDHSSYENSASKQPRRMIFTYSRHRSSKTEEATFKGQSEIASSGERIESTMNSPPNTSVREEIRLEELVVPVVITISHFQNQPVHGMSIIGADYSKVPNKIEYPETIPLEDNLDPISYSNIQPKFHKIRQTFKNNLNRLDLERREPSVPEVNPVREYDQIYVERSE